MSGFEPVQLERLDPKVTSRVLGEIRHGRRGGRPDVRLLGGWFVFDSPDSELLVSLLPALVHVRGVERLSTLVRLVGEEASERKPGRDLVLTRLVEVLLIEAMRLAPGEDSPPGLLRGLADRAARAGDPRDARQAGAFVDGGSTRAIGRALAVFVLRTFHAHRRRAADGIPARLAYGRREGPVAPPRSSDRGGRRTGRLRFGQHLQYRVQTARRAAAESLRVERPRVTGVTVTDSCYVGPGGDSWVASARRPPI